ncbi:hypothetical protein PsAD37_04743 [Pseudovibrio sp. Ad37]|nr:hypothetical protein PsAD37_04743 [Pseudovibrio sp. Ad37]
MAVQAVPATLSCFKTPACLTEVTVALAEGAAGDALGGSTLMTTGVVVAVKSADKLRAIDGLLDDIANGVVISKGGGTIESVNGQTRYSNALFNTEIRDTQLATTELVGNVRKRGAVAQFEISLQPAQSHASDHAETFSNVARPKAVIVLRTARPSFTSIPSKRSANSCLTGVPS